MKTAVRFIAAVITIFCAQAEEPFAFERTPGKLPKSIVPVKYDITIAPDIETSSFHGYEVIAIDVRKPVREIVLNSLNLDIDKAVLHGGKSAALAPRLDPAMQTLTFPLEEELPAGTYSISIDYHGKLNEQPEGLFLTRYRVGSVEKVALATQFEATDARRMFPCWDEPVFRAVYQLTAFVPKHFTAISNMAADAGEIEHNRLSGKGIAFAPTPPMPSYLLAFAAGEFDELRDEADGIQLGVYFTEGKREQAAYALEVTKKVVPYYNHYFGVKYPLPKLDQISFANTSAGGMENWGCIVYSDTAFLFDPKTSSQSVKERVFAVVAHEIAHQWFGDLVTMAWWDNLWLNEGFASWMESKASDHFNPEWHVSTRAAGQKEWAMALDARATTHPIQQPVASESQANDAFDEITYQKGQSFIRMLESWLGEDAFRDGIRHYMAKHKLGNTTTADLWNALAEVSGKPVGEFAAGWTEQPGFPLVKISANNAELSLTQERFTLNQKDAKPLDWKIPVGLGPALLPTKKRMLTLDSTRIGRFPFDPKELFKANIGDLGYFRVQYDGALFARLLEQAPKLQEADRLNLLNDTWALVEADRIQATDYLMLVTVLANDDAFAVVDQIVGKLLFVDGLQRDRSERQPFDQWAGQFLAPQWSKLGWDARPGESALDDHRRNSVIRALGRLGYEPIIAEARKRFNNSIAHPELLTGELRDTVWNIVGRYSDARSFGQLHELARHTDSTEEKRSLYGAMAAAKSLELSAKTLAISLSDELPPQHAARLVQRVAGDGEHAEEAWAFVRANRAALFAKLSTFQSRDYVPGIFDGFSDEKQADELEAWTRASLPADAAVHASRTADAIRFKARLKTRLLPQIDAWCCAHPRQ